MNSTSLTPVLISGVSCYEQDGTAYLRLEDVARGLGFTQTQKKNGVEYASIRWETINRYLEEIGFPNKLGKDDYIPENIFYRLAMKAKNETAEKFQTLVADEIIPSIRKTGGYSVNSTSDKRLRIMEMNARTRAANQMTKLWTAAGVSPQYQALALNGYFEGVSLPREAFGELCPALLDATTIAAHLGILSVSGKPHNLAVSALIGELDLDESERALTPYSHNGHDGVSMQYTASVEDKVRAWLDAHGRPSTILAGGKKYAVKYREK